MDFSQKLHHVPVPAYILKFVQDRTQNGVYYPPARHITIHTNYQYAKAALARRTTYNTVLTVQIPRANPVVAYFLANTLSKEFRERMYSSMAVAVKQGGSALTALRVFLDLYGITDEEYDIGSAYRNWLRHKEKAFNPTAPVLKKPSPKAANSNQLSLF